MPRSSRAVSGSFIDIDWSGVEKLDRGFADLPLATRRELRPKVLEAAELVADTARENAAFSSWIPSAIEVRAPLGVQTVAQVFVDSGEAPAGHEPLPRLEEFGVPFFRHPVFGTDAWVSQEGHPFLFPAIEERRDEVIELFESAVHDAAVSVGLI